MGGKSKWGECVYVCGFGIVLWPNGLRRRVYELAPPTKFIVCLSIGGVRREKFLVTEMGVLGDDGNCSGRVGLSAQRTSWDKI